MSTVMTRRTALGTLSAATGAVLAAACDGNPVTGPTGSADAGTSTTTAATTTTAPASGACVVVPSETAGPYPSKSDMYRSDVREGKAGTPLTLTLKVVNANNGCAAVSGADVEIWHCDERGDYSQYGSASAATFLRGIQTTNGAGEVTFVTNYPGWYQGRATHIHIEVVMNGRSVKVTQIAFPESINNTVYATGVYASRGANPMANAADGIFADSLGQELVTPSGSASGGYAASFQVGISV